MGEDGEALNGKSNYYFKINPEGTLDILKCDSDRTCQVIAYIDAHPKFVQDIGAVANEMKNIERKQQGRIYRPRVLKELFSE